jgi:hypothetical protein
MPMKVRLSTYNIFDFSNNELILRESPMHIITVVTGWYELCLDSISNNSLYLLVCWALLRSSSYLGSVILLPLFVSL